MGKLLITGPDEEPITLSEVKEQQRVDHHVDDGLITGLISTARKRAEHQTGRVLITQKWRVTLSAWPAEIELPNPPLTSVETITYLDTSGIRQTLANTEYQVITDEIIGRIIPAYNKTWPTAREIPGSIQIDYTAGYGNASAVPQPIKAWMHLAIGTWYENRAATTEKSAYELPYGFGQGLLDEYFVPRL